jgi:hypothetical protein
VIGSVFAFKCRLQILGVIREDVGQGADYKAAATDAFKRAAVRFGIGHELYSYEQNWVQVDGDGRFAQPVEDPNDVYERRQAARKGAGGSGAERAASGAKSAAPGKAGNTGQYRRCPAKARPDVHAARATSHAA